MNDITNILYKVYNLILGSKWLTFIAVCLSVFFIYRLGKATGEFIYNVTH